MSNAHAALVLMQDIPGTWTDRLDAWSTWLTEAYVECLPTVDIVIATLTTHATPVPTTHKTTTHKTTPKVTHKPAATVADISFGVAASTAAILALVWL